jgi:hypothetical protein
VNLINAISAFEASRTPQYEYLVGWAINRMWQLQIDSWVMVNPSSTSESFVLESFSSPASTSLQSLYHDQSFKMSRWLARHVFNRDLYKDCIKLYELYSELCQQPVFMVGGA